MSAETETGIRLGLYVLGWATSILWPYLIAYFKDGAPFNWRLVMGRIVAGIIGLVTFLATDGFVAQLGAMSFLAAFLAGFGASSAGRNAQRTVDARRTPA